MSFSIARHRVHHRRWAPLVAATLSALTLLIAHAAPVRASESVYFGFNNNNINASVSGVGKIGVDGSGIREDLIASPVSPGLQGGLAATSTHVYYQVAEGLAATRPVFRANADGSGTPALLFTPCSTSSSFSNAAEALATDGQYLYYVCRDSSMSTGSRIGRIGLDGSGQTDEFINPGGSRIPSQIAVNATHVYMATMTDIVRANVTAPANPITTSAMGGPGGIAVNGSHVYWTVGGGSPAIKRAGLDLTNVEDVVTGITRPVAIAVTDAAIFWSVGTPATAIAKADASGGNRNLSFVPSSSRGTIMSLAVAVATAQPSPTTPAATTPTTTAPAVAPTVKTSDLKRQTTLTRAGRTLSTAVDCGTTNGATLKACTVELVVPSSALKQGRAAKGKTTVIGKATRTVTAGTAAIAVTVRVTNPAAKRLLAMKGHLRATVRITATSTADQIGTASRATTLVVAGKKAAKAGFRR